MKQNILEFRRDTNELPTTKIAANHIFRKVELKLMDHGVFNMNHQSFFPRKKTTLQNPLHNTKSSPKYLVSKFPESAGVTSNSFSSLALGST